ncbi:MAG: DUF2330 domain-containing protein [Myxococcota bacterium]
MNLSRVFIVLVVALTGLAPRSAKACGGFFCNNAQPVNQAAERIIFAQNADGTTTAVIEILYQGPSEEFAWMLPVQGRPDIDVSSSSAFNTLQNLTDPIYRLETQVEGECFVDPNPPPMFFDAGLADQSFGAETGADPVTVVDSGSVGPFDFVIISVDLEVDNVGELAALWLSDNGYDVNEFGVDRLVPYLESGMNLLAFRLSKGRTTGEIRPVRLSFGEGLPSIPLRPTAAAAEPDMGILVWVLGEARAIPANYRDLELNEARINWFNYRRTYNDVITAAANEAGGQGFVTEMAGPSAPLGEMIYTDAAQGTLESLQSAAAVSGADHGALLREAATAYRGWDGLLEAFRAEIPKPEGISDEEWINNTGFFLNDLIFSAEIEGFDPVSFVERLDAEVVAPVRETAELFTVDRKTTRFYTTMSSDEMTVDPVFDFNADLPDYSREHVRTQIIECAPSVTRSEAPWRVLFDDGLVVRGSGFGWPSDLDETPANARVRRIGNEGMGEVITDNADAIREAVQASNANFPGPPPGPRPAVDAGPRSDAGGDFRDGDVDESTSDSDDGCSANGSGGALTSLLLLSLFTTRRRRAA